MGLRWWSTRALRAAVTVCAAALVLVAGIAVTRSEPARAEVTASVTNFAP